MSPESLPTLDRARQFLHQARSARYDAAWDLVGFGAYTAAFHAATVLIFERARLTPKTHNGVKSELNRLAKLDPAMDRDLVGQFAKFGAARNNAVYGKVQLDNEPALNALAWAERFVAEVERVLA